MTGYLSDAWRNAKERRIVRRGRAAGMRAGGMTLKAIGAALGCSSQTVRELLREAAEGRETALPGNGKSDE